MSLTWQLTTALLFLSYFKFTHALPTNNNRINIHMAFFHKAPNPRDPITAICLDAPAGGCCQPHKEALLPSPSISSLEDYASTKISFTGLALGQSGLGWRAMGGGFPTECAGMPFIHTDPRYEVREKTLRTPPVGQPPRLDNMVFAANWADLGLAGRGRGGVGGVLERPMRRLYPDVYGVNGTSYRVRQDGLYRSAEGKVLDLKLMKES
ncbi:MAG: hypothetical protein Q9184_007222 [Pyrenodesmia sp. 2 TL-2023]